jgi:hypothetical protein
MNVIKYIKTESARLCAQACAWSQSEPEAAHLGALGAARTEHAGAVLGDGRTVMLVGGRSGGDYSAPPLLLGV